MTCRYDPARGVFEIHTFTHDIKHVDTSLMWSEIDWLYMMRGFSLQLPEQDTNVMPGMYDKLIDCYSDFLMQIHENG